MDEIRVIRVKTFIARNKGFFLRTIDYISYFLPALLAGLIQKKPHVIMATCPTPFAALAAWGVSAAYEYLLFSKSATYGLRLLLPLALCVKDF